MIFFLWGEDSGVPVVSSLFLFCKYTHTHIYIYIYAVGLISWPHFGHFKVNNLATVRSITWPPFFEPIKIVFFTVFRGWCKLVFLKVVFGQKRGFRKKHCAPFLGGV